MNKLLTAIGLLLLFNVGNVTGQDFDNYQYIRSAGNVPNKFIISSTEKYKEEAKKNISTKDKAYIKKSKDKFFLESSFAIDELLLSGKVMFNDPVSVYVNRVMDELLKDNKTLRNKVEVYVVKSSSVNAFTTNNGLVFVCMGLIAQLENEAQLAYVLSHELIHFEKQHALDELVETTNIERGAGKYRQSSYDEKLLARSNYSKEKETESDLDGLQMYMKTNYDLETIDGVFDVLQYAYLPFDEVIFKKEFLETK
ncbi:MAG: M48 family metallopeptidase, partial [Bacteroidia bacterium]